MSLVYSWVNFFVFFGALIYFLRTPVRDFLGDRRENLKKELEDVARERLNIESQFQVYRKKMAAADAEIENLKKELREEGDLEKKILVKRAQEFTQKIREDAGRVGGQELNKAKAFLRKKTLLMSVELAREYLKNAVQDQDQERLFALGISQLERAGE